MSPPKDPVACGQVDSLHRTIEPAPVAMLAVYADGRIRAANQAAARIFGRPIADLLTRRIEDLLPARFRAAHRNHLRRYDGRARPMGIGRQTPALRADGTEFSADIGLGPIAGDGILVTITDISARECAGEALMSVSIEHAPVALAMFDRQLRYVAVSQRWLSDYGLTREILGRSHYDVFPHMAERWRAVHELGLAGESVQMEEDRIELPDGGVRWLRWAVRPWRSATGDVGGIAMFTEDITARKQAEAERNTLRSEFEEVARLHVASQTAAAIAHDLNQPLNAIACYTETALRLLRADHPSPDMLRRALEGSVQQTHRAGQVMHELLRFFQDRETAVGPVDLNSAIYRSLAVVEGNGAGGFHASIDVVPNLPPVRANRLQVERVLVNLLYNSVDAMRDAGIFPTAITLAVRHAAGGGFAQVTVRDNGPGLNEAEAEDVFKPFYTTKAHGTGMGLTVSRALIEASRGKLWCEAAPGRGGVFHFTLPFAS